MAATSAMWSGRRSRMTRPVMLSASGTSLRPASLGERAAPGDRADHLVVVDDEDAQLVGGEQLLAAVEDLLEHRRRVRHRAADHAQHLGRGAQLVERLLGLVEQPRVLDRDHGLVGEGPQQVDLGSARTAAPDRAADDDDADRLALAHHRHGQHARESRSAPAARARRDIRCRSADDVATWTGGARGRARPTIESVGASARSPSDRARRRCRSWSWRLQRSSPPIARRGCRRLAQQRRRRSATMSSTGCTSVGELADDLEHLGGRRLPLERLLGLVEQAHVLDRDHRLVGEGPEQRDFLSQRIGRAVRASQRLINRSRLAVAQHAARRARRRKPPRLARSRRR